MMKEQGMMKIGDKVGINIKKQRAEYRKSASWYNSSIPYDQDHILNDKHKEFANILFDSLGLNTGIKIEHKYLDFQILLANLFYQIKKPIRISLNRNDWKKTKYNKCSYFTVEMLSVMEDNKLINMKKGYFLEDGSRMTRISPTEKLLELFPEYPNSVILDPKELVILKDKKGKLKDYKDTRETWRVRDTLRLVNEVNAKADIRFDGYKIQSYLRAIYIEKFTWYGRLHTKGFMHYQGLSGGNKKQPNERKRITINGDPIVELDFSGLHPYLLYAQEGIQYFHDPYSVIDNRPKVRPFLKEILLCMLNSKDFVTAERASNNWLYKHHEEREILNSLGITRAKPLMEKFIEEHKPIAHYFCNGKDTGMRIMNKDAKIALDIVNHFAKQSIPILAIHDSFIVQEKHKDELYQTMKSTYKKHTGYRIKIK